MAKPTRPTNVHPNAPAGRSVRDVIQDAYSKRAHDAYRSNLEKQRASADAEFDQRRAAERDRDRETLERAQDALNGQEIERQELSADTWTGYRMRIEDENAARVAAGHKPWSSDEVTERARKAAFLDVAARTLEAAH